MFVKRDSSGAICAVSLAATTEVMEEIADDSAELLVFLQQLRPEMEQSLVQTDLQMARVLEDVVNLLIDKSVIRFTDLPEAAQSKLLIRKEMRGKFQSITLLDDDEEDFKL